MKRDIRHWTARAKFIVVDDVNNSRISVHEACETYGLSREELTCWMRRVANNQTLKATKKVSA